MSNPYQEHFKKAKKSSGNGSTPKSQKIRTARHGFPIVPGLVLAILTGLMGWAYSNLDYVEEQIAKIEIGFFGTANAQEEKAKTSGGNQENSAATTTAADSKECPDPSTATPEEVSHFSKLSDRKKELDLREQELNALEEELHKQRQEVEARIAKLDGIRGEIGTVLKEKIQVDEERVARLVEFYSNMKPKQAAEIFNDLNEGLAVEVLGRMKKKNAAEIMNLLEPKKAQALSEKFAGYKRR